MVSTETESRFSRLLQELAQGESEVEIARETLSYQVGLDLRAVFDKIDFELKGFIDAIDLVTFLKNNSVFITTLEADQIIFHYDTDLDNRLTYIEFLNLAVSDNNSSLRASSSFSGKPVSYDVEYSVVKLLEKEVKLVRNVSSVVRELNIRHDFNSCDIFRSLDAFSLDNISAECLRRFLDRNFVKYTERDITNIIKRLDADRNFRVDFAEFRRFISIYGGEFYYHTTCLTCCYCPSTCYYSPIRRRYYYSPLRCYSPLISHTHYCSPLRYYSPYRRYYSPYRSTLRYESPLKKTQDVLSGSTLRTTGTTNQFRSNSNLANASPNRTNRFTSPPRSNQRVRSPPRNFKTTGSIYSETRSNLNLSPSRKSVEEELFQDYLIQLLRLENDIEGSKLEVALKPDFNMEDAFSIFEKLNRGYLTDFDFKDGLNNYFGLYPSLEEINVLFKRYDTRKTGTLR